MDDACIILEYQLPLSSRRIDSMIVGTDKSRRKQAVLVEFKQWDKCEPSPTPEVVMVGGCDLLHPSAQVRNYRRYLQDAHSAFVDEAIILSSCAYLHNVRAKRDSNFFDGRYAKELDDSPVYCLESVDELANFIGPKTRFGAPVSLVESIIRGEYLPSRKLLEHVAAAIAGQEAWKLLDEQQLVFNEIIGDIELAKQNGEKRVIIVTGGPGTGKSVIAVQVLGAAAKKGYNVVHATGSKAFTTTMRGIVGRDALFRYTHNFIESLPNSIDLIVCDEAHRLRRETKFAGVLKSPDPQWEQVIDSARVSVFLLDKQQSVKPNEIGSVSPIKDHAAGRGIQVITHDLAVQVRTAGSESYINWIDYVLGLSPNRTLAWKRHEEYEVKVFNQVEQLEGELLGKIRLGSTARMVAGFCWKWSDPLPNGALVPDVKIGSWARPWNRKPKDMCKPRGKAEPDATHPYKKWATQPERFDQIGCIYSAQGQEFDYVGVIFGSDLLWDSTTISWKADLRNSEDKGLKSELGKAQKTGLDELQNTYRVLSTRGMKGTYFFFLDESTRNHFEQCHGGV